MINLGGKNRGGLPVAQENRPADVLNTSVATTTDIRPQKGRRAPTVHASAYAPGGRRQRWMAAYVCRHCGRGHIAFAWSVDGLRALRHRGSCGRIVVIRVARVYPTMAKAVGE